MNGLALITDMESIKVGNKKNHQDWFLIPGGHGAGHSDYFIEY